MFLFDEGPTLETLDFTFHTGVTGPDAPLQIAPPPGHLVLGPDAPLHHTGLSSSFETNF